MHSGVLQQPICFFNVQSRMQWLAQAITSSNFFIVELQICQESFSHKKMKKKMKSFLFVYCH